MAIKKIHVGFDIEMDVFMKMLQHGSSSVRVDFFGEQPKQPKQLKQQEPKLLEAPKRVGSKSVVMNFAKQHQDGFRPKELVPLIEAAGYAANTHSPVLMWLMSRGYLKRDKHGVYFPTTKGMTYDS